MHKFYWRNTHGPAARTENFRMGKSGSADNILSEVRHIGSASDWSVLLVCAKWL